MLRCFYALLFLFQPSHMRKHVWKEILTVLNVVPYVIHVPMVAIIRRELSIVPVAKNLQSAFTKSIHTIIIAQIVTMKKKEKL